MDAAITAWVHLMHHPSGRHREVMEDQQVIAGSEPPSCPHVWTALALLQGDAEITAAVRQRLGDRWEEVDSLLRQHEDAVLDIASGRYQWIGRMVRAAVRRPHPGELTLTDRLDRVLTHPVAGLGCFHGAGPATFWLTMLPAQEFVEEHVVQALAQWVREAEHSPADIGIDGR